MARKRFTAEQIIMKLREAEVGLAQGQTVGQVCKQIGVTSSCQEVCKRHQAAFSSDTSLTGTPFTYLAPW